jgi:DNA adenine methylase
MTASVTDSALQPPLKWAGGKRWLVGTLSRLWDPRRRLVEPFVGGMAVALGLRPERALLNDANPHLMSFYTWIQRGMRCSVPMENAAEVYYAHRARFNDLVSAGEGHSSEAAELFYYLNRTGFNGLCRFNASGGFNVPFGRYAKIAYRKDFAPYAHVFDRWTLTGGDFTALNVDEGDWVYADPPYDVPFTSYTGGGFSWDDQVRLARWLAALPCPVVASNQATPRVLKLYAELGFSLTVLPAPRRISCSGDRTPADEMLATRGC